MREFLLVAVGGALGASGRYGVSLLALRQWGANPIWGTLLVNVAGGLAMGLLAGFAADKRTLLLLLGVGVLGGFTTFSAFSIEVVRMIDRGGAHIALSYALASVLLSVGAAYLGLIVARSLT